MNGRILELAKAPELIQHSDIDLLKKEIDKHPYLQSVRAIYLLATHRLNSENYANEISVTAAYTTDKKILYQLINSKPLQKSVTEEIASEENNKEESAENQTVLEEENKVSGDEKHEKYTAITAAEITPPAPVYVNGELNRILFPGEEDFLSRETPAIDLETSLEAGTLVTEKNIPVETVEITDFTKAEVPVEETEIISENTSTASENEISEMVEETHIFSHKLDESLDSAFTNSVDETTEKSEVDTSNTAEFTKEQIIKEDEIATQEPVIEDSTELSFHGLTEFLPDVKIASNPKQEIITEAPKATPNRHEEEMKRLLAEVEAKMKASKKPKIQAVEEVENNSDLNFSETQSFEISTPKESKVQEEIVFVKPEETTLLKIEEEPVKAAEIAPKPEMPSTWKPMSVAVNLPDALLSNTRKDVDVKAPETKSAESVAVTEITDTVQKENSIESSEPETIENEKEHSEIQEESNIPTFINTWQSWLKIDRTQAQPERKEISITEVKNKVIETFIEKEPKISKLKEESDFVIKERTDDIWHLMTETLANLYVEQKLYAKAIKAFGVLIEKHPQKKAYFQEKVKEIKELRQNK